MNTNYFFSICIPAYNREYTLRRCLDSLVRQTFRNFEVLLVDDGSCDNTENLVKDYFNILNIRYFKKENGGKHTALNVGIEKANYSTFFMILDSDDWLLPDALEHFYRIWDKFDETKKKEYCGIMGKCCDQTNTILGEKFPSDPYISSYVDFHFGNIEAGDCCECIRTDLIKKYRYPEPPNTKFVPEFYIFDQIGVDYKLFCVNDVFKKVEYMPDGITQGGIEFVEKNCVGFSYGVVCQLEKVIPFCDISLKKKWELWKEYWWLKSLDDTNSGAKINKKNIFYITSWMWFQCVKIKKRIMK